MELVPLDHQTYAIVVDEAEVGRISLRARTEPGVAEAHLELHDTARGKGLSVGAVRALLARAADDGLHTVVATVDAANEAAMGLLRSLRADTTAEDGLVHVEVETDPSRQLAYLRELSQADREAWLASYSRAADTNWWMHRLLVLNHHPEWADLKTWLVDQHVRLFGRPPGRQRRGA